MRKFFIVPLLMITGGVLYCFIEVLWRGFTHWSMGIAGGICFLILYYLNSRCPEVPLLVRCIAGSFCICAVEYISGFIFNIVLGMNVWDYSGLIFNIYGQVCPLYAFLWFLLCIPGFWLTTKFSIIFRRVLCEKGM